MACLLRGQKIKSVFRFPFLAGLSHGWHWQAGTADSPSYMPANLKKTKKNGRGRGRADTGAGRGRPALISCGEGAGQGRYYLFRFLFGRFRSTCSSAA